MLKSRLLIVGLLAVPACTVPHPYSVYPAQAPVDEWSPSTPHSAALTTEDGTVVVFVVDELAMAKVTREARNQGRMVVQVHVGSDSWVTDTDRPASIGSVGWVKSKEVVDTTPATTVSPAVPDKLVTTPLRHVSIAKSTLEPTIRPTPEPTTQPTLEPTTQPVVTPQQVAVTAPSATHEQVAVDTTPQPRIYGWHTPTSSTPAPSPVVENTPVVEQAPATVASVGAPLKPGFNTPPVVETPEPVIEPVVETPEPVIEPVVETPEPVIEPVVETPEPVIEPSRPTTRTLRVTGPRTRHGYTAYGAATGNQSSARFQSTNRNASPLSLPRLDNPTETETETETESTAPAKSSLSKKKTTSSFWGPKR